MKSMKPFLLLSFNIIALMLFEAYGFTDETDRQALLKFKSQVLEAKRDVLLSSWNSSTPFCNWKGVTCGRKHKRVTRLDLGGLQLGGVISPSIGNLSFLISLDLSDNSFGGTIPPELGKLFRLKQLNMSSNFLGGRIPLSLFNCSNLSDLDFNKNYLGGDLPLELGSLTKLVRLNLGDNNMDGKLPATLGNLTSLREVAFHHNNFEGGIPDDLGTLTQLSLLSLSGNNFSGVFPPAFYNLSSLEYLYIPDNQFSGFLRSDFGNLLPNLQDLNMASNHFTGGIPTTLYNISSLRRFGINENSMTGSISPSFGNLGNLQLLALGGNILGGKSLDFLGALTNCTKLETLLLYRNSLRGDLPASMANLSKNLVFLDLSSNFISGSIPYEIGNLINLQIIGLNENKLAGPLPTSIGKLVGLEFLSLHSNNISGEIPSSLGNITRLATLYLHNNSFEGAIPPSLGRCNLLYLNLGFNKLNGTIPPEIMGIRSLVKLGMSNNSLTGSLPKDVGRLENLLGLYVPNNKLSGELPQDLGKCLSMEELELQINYFDGVIPDISGLVGLKRVDLSNNNLSGSIPGYLANFSSLEYLNLSVNNLEGRVPTQGKFQNATTVLVFGNKELCGGIKELHLKPCIVQGQLVVTKHPSHLKKITIGVSVGIALLLLLFIASVSLIWFRKRKKNHQANNSPPSTLGAFHEKISYVDLRNATDGFLSSNLVGSGSFGTVFKAFLPAMNNVVAIKVLNMQRHGAMKSFMAECESLKDIRHRNLVKLLTACSSIDFQGNDFRALIYEFMPNGSLDMWLHREEVENIRRPSRTLTLLERLNIAIDVASVLDYLHVHCHEPIAHCDIKPSNVLLDDDLTAHVSDFGMAHLLLKFDKDSFLNQLSSAGVRGTIGYVAPEYGVGQKPSIHGDMYSFGVLLLEMLTEKRPTDELFGGNLTIHGYTKSALPERVLDIVDQSILHSDLKFGFPVAECLTLILEVGLRCCEELPSNRLATSDATKELISIKERFFKATRTTKS